MLLLYACSLLLDAAPKQVSVEADGKKRQALVFFPEAKSETPAPLVFAFHGHGGGSRNAARSFNVHKHWPEAVVAYPQGLPGVVGITDPEGAKTGWQKNPGELEDRDLKFFDALFAELQKQANIDLRRVYVMGHSNGSRFACVLWAKRGDKFAAVGTSGGQGGAMLRDAVKLPAVLVAGEKDPLVPYAGQLLSINALKKAYGCDAATAKKDGFWSLERGKDGLELATYLHPGGHEYPSSQVPKMVEFFKRQVRKEPMKDQQQRP